MPIRSPLRGEYPYMPSFGRFGGDLAYQISLSPLGLAIPGLSEPRHLGKLFTFQAHQAYQSCWADQRTCTCTMSGGQPYQLKRSRDQKTLDWHQTDHFSTVSDYWLALGKRTISRPRVPALLGNKSCRTETRRGVKVKSILCRFSTGKWSSYNHREYCRGLSIDLQMIWKSAWHQKR